MPIHTIWFFYFLYYFIIIYLNTDIAIDWNAHKVYTQWIFEGLSYTTPSKVDYDHLKMFETW